MSTNLEDRPIPTRLLAVCMVLAPVLSLAGALLGFQGTGNIEQEVVFISRDAGQYLASNILWMASSFLYIPTALGLLYLVPNRLYRWGLVGASFLLVGGFAHGLVISYTQPQIPLLESNLNQAAVSTFISTGLYNHSAFFILLIPFLGFYLGLIVLVIVLWRADVAPVWVSALIVVALALGFAWNHPAKNEVMSGLLIVGLGFLARKLWVAGEGRLIKGETAAD